MSRSSVERTAASSVGRVAAALILVLLLAGCGGTAVGRRSVRLASPLPRRLPAPAAPIGSPPASDCSIDRLFLADEAAQTRDDPEVMIGKISAAGSLGGANPREMASNDLRVASRLARTQASFVGSLQKLRSKQPRPFGTESFDVLLTLERRITGDLVGVAATLQRVRRTPTQPSVDRSEESVDLLGVDENAALNAAHGFDVRGPGVPERIPGCPGT
jgi:hypothetical protein